MEKHPLSQYVTAVIIVLIAVNALFYFYNKAKFPDVIKYSLGFLLGMLAMYIAVHVYKWQ